MPTEESRPTLSSLVKQTADYIMQTDNMDEDKKVLVHCMAGCGRTGTFLAILNLYIQVLVQLKELKSLSKVKLSPFAVVRKLRQ